MGAITGISFTEKTRLNRYYSVIGNKMSSYTLEKEKKFTEKCYNTYGFSVNCREQELKTQADHRLGGRKKSPDRFRKAIPLNTEFADECIGNYNRKENRETL